MIQLDYKDHSPLYEQIKEKIKSLMINNVLKINEKIPSVRELAQSLTINPNTIQKAYRELEAEGFIYSIQGKGSFVAPLTKTVNEIKKNELINDLKKTVSELLYLNTPKELVLEGIETVYSKKEALTID